MVRITNILGDGYELDTQTNVFYDFTGNIISESEAENILKNSAKYFNHKFLRQIIYVLIASIIVSLAIVLLIK